MNEFESDWISLSQILNLRGSVSEVFFCGKGGNQSWPVWVILRGKTKMAESKMAKFKKAAIIKLSQNEWVKFFCANGGNQILASVSEFERKN